MPAMCMHNTKMPLENITLLGNKPTLSKYPRTLHIPCSPGATSDDKRLNDCDHFHDKEVVITIKYDGENTSLYPNYIHARSLDGRSHPSRDWVKTLHRNIKDNIPKGCRICGENLYAQHSIPYDNLPSYFLTFSIWNEHNACVDWDSTLRALQLLGLTPVEELYRGVYDEAVVKALAQSNESAGREGFVIRIADAFHYDDFATSVAKYVRANHVTTSEHWMRSTIIKNKLAK